MRKPAFTVMNDIVLLFGRVAIASVFIPAGFSKLTNLAGFAASLEGRGVPMSSILAPLGAGIEFFGAIAVLLGIQVRLAAVLMIVFTIAATLIGHRFWEFEAAARQTQRGQFLKNLGLIGGFLFLVANGGGRYCIDRLWRASSERRAAQAGRRTTDRSLTGYAGKMIP
jgi:putative oxidoreductase